MVIQTLGIASCLGGSDYKCGYTAEMLRHEYDHSSHADFCLQWHLLQPDNKGTNEQQLVRLNRTHSQYSAICFKTGHTFLVIGGDHSCALGTWSGVLNALDTPKKLGLIWLDAHLDAHTFTTTPSGNIHGMPVAALLGYADKKLAGYYPSHFTIEPANLKMIGIRSYEKEEYKLLDQLGVSITFADQISNLSRLLSTAVLQLSQTCQAIGITVDLDVIDPVDAPGVETPVNGGISAEELITALSDIRNNSKICALEISECSPEKDVNNKTLHIIKRLVDAYYQP